MHDPNTLARRAAEAIIASARGQEQCDFCGQPNVAEMAAIIEREMGEREKVIQRLGDKVVAMELENKNLESRLRAAQNALDAICDRDGMPSRQF